ncbi:proteasome assembly chaperone family protein [Candidatus Micrarchaeota archaeon]|nr:proteasome assembly chaperone family protein [Candidatus Micrarchaeota archaeon]
MKETTIIEKTKMKKLRTPVLVTGLPGIGLIGQVVGRYLVEELKAKKVANLISPHFPHQVFMTKKGGIKLIKNSFYHYKGKKRDVVILVGDIQAMSSPGQYEVAGKITEYCKHHGIKEVLTIGGYSTGKLEEKRNLYAVATSEIIRKKLRKLNVRIGEAKGSIVGAAGILPAFAKMHGFDGACIMGETHGSYIDSHAAKQIVILLSKYLGIPINIKRLEEKARESQQILKKVQEEVEKTMEAQADAETKRVSYIR